MRDLEGAHVAAGSPPRPRTPRSSVVVRLSGDSGDGIQVAGGQLALATALSGADLETFPDFPAEIRAPAGTTFGVSSFQIHIADHRVHTVGDRPDLLVALNPAALKVNLPDLRPGALVILDPGTFKKRELERAGFTCDPRADGTLGPFRVLEIPIEELTRKATAGTGVSARDAGRAKNFWALGLVLWMHDRDTRSVEAWLARRFSNEPALLAANRAALAAGHSYGEVSELSIPAFTVGRARLEPGTYRTVNGLEALAFGLLAGGRDAGLELVYCSYPITPASGLLHQLANLRPLGVTTFQAEDEIAAISAAIGASYAGALGVTGTSGPGMALKTEALGLAAAVELPLVVIDVQRAGPSTGMPTKTEQSDLFQAVFGRNGEAPLVVLAAATPADAFAVAREAVRLAVHHMTPVVLLADGFLANAAEPWRIPELSPEPAFPVRFHTNREGFRPYRRDGRGVRPWVVPGTPGLAHRISGLERDFETGAISYDPTNHARMTAARRAKILAVADDVPPAALEQGEPDDRLVLVGWGSTYGAIADAVAAARARGRAVAHLHLRHLWPLPRGLGPLLAGFDRVLVPEMNTGQLAALLRAELLVPAEPLTKVTGRPFTVEELSRAIEARLEEAP
ncbi:MAG: 2-oxoglutarate ferredoxin oxidoreductase subunit alpha [Geminicoccaceae bacterium]|nr:MAG: 2-oxoglutarate ferredoxin oxidoreductase subunit alpha [Geminicoccaceae bacterium]